MATPFLAMTDGGSGLAALKGLAMTDGGSGLATLDSQ